MQVSAATIARATGGVDGDWYDFVNLTGGNFITTQELPAAEAAEGGVREDANKISYYTPVFSGFQLGVSYTPDEGDSGTIAGATGKNNGDNENVFDLGLSYSKDFNGLGVSSALVGEFGESETAGVEDTAAWSFGLALDYQGFSVAGSYTDWADSGLATGSTEDNQNAWTLGAAYETGPFGVSVTYLDSEGSNGVASNDLQNLVVGADYTLAPGLVPYVEVSFFDTDDNTAGTADNDGSVVLVGAELTF
jgi:outer membrane protein OmpU